MFAPLPYLLALRQFPCSENLRL